MTRKTATLCAAVAGAAAGLWYLAVAHHPQPASSAQRVTSSVEMEAPAAYPPAPAGGGRWRRGPPPPPAGGERRQPSAAPLAADPTVLNASEPLAEEEQAARELARESIEDQPPDAQERHHQAWAEGLAHSNSRRRDAIARLEADRANVDPSLQPALDEAIRVRQKLLQEREREADVALSHVKSAP